MTARGYGSGTRTRVTEASHTTAERLTMAIGLTLTAVAVATIAFGLAGYSYYPTLDPVTGGGAVAVAAATLAGLAAAALVLRR